MDLLKELSLFKQALKEYKNLLGQITFHQPLPDGYQSKRESLLVASSHLIPQIKRLTNKDESLEIYEFGKPRTRNMWEMGLRNEYDYRTVEAIDACIDNVTVAIGNLKTDIEMGIRDKQGKLIGEQLRRTATEPPRAFISHGKESAALRKLKEFIETLGIEPLIVKKQPSLDKDLPDKVNSYLSQADFVIVLATADDKVEGKFQPRQNVIHEIGLAQNTHSGRIIYLLEEGAEFPSNIRPKVWESFKQRNMMDAFLGILRELRAYGMLKVIKTPSKE